MVKARWLSLSGAVFGLFVLWGAWMWGQEGKPESPSEGGETGDGVLILPSLGADPEVLKEHPFAEKCFKCHGKEIAAREWALSGHARNLATLRKSPLAADSCLSCHSSGYRPLSVSEWGVVQEREYPTLETVINEVSCSSCHSHASSRKHYLLRPVSELCASCHKMDCGCAGKGVVHQSQVEMFFGREGKGVPRTPSKHAREMRGNCAVCHMYRPKDAEKTALSSGGHTFKATMESCLPCHNDAPQQIAAFKSEIGELLKRVGDTLERADRSVVPKETYEAAKLNYDMVRGDSGIGLHNPTYAKALLNQSLQFLGVSGESAQGGSTDVRSEGRGRAGASNSPAAP